jgi:hypothetical protein
LSCHKRGKFDTSQIKEAKGKKVKSHVTLSYGHAIDIIKEPAMDSILSYGRGSIASLFITTFTITSQNYLPRG